MPGMEILVAGCGTTTPVDRAVVIDGGGSRLPRG